MTEKDISDIVEAIDVKKTLLFNSKYICSFSTQVQEEDFILDSASPQWSVKIKTEYHRLGEDNFRNGDIFIHYNKDILSSKVSMTLFEKDDKNKYENMITITSYEIQ